MSDAVDEHLDKAFASLDDIPSRELYATAEALERRKEARVTSPASSVTSPAFAKASGLWRP